MMFRRGKMAEGLKLGLILVFGLTFSAVAAEQIKLGYVDMQRAIQETAAGKKAKSELEAEFNKRKKELEKHEADLKKKSEDFEKRAMVLSEDVRAERQIELQREMAKYRDLVGRSQMEIQKMERDLTQPILERMSQVIEEIAKKEGYSMILERSEQNVLWAKDELDLTDKVIKEVDATDSAGSSRRRRR